MSVLHVGSARGVTALRRRPRADRSQLRREGRRAVFHHRPQRRRQDLDRQLHFRPLQADRRPAVLPRQGHHRPSPERPRHARHRPHLPEPGAVPPHERARQHHGRAASPAEEQFPHGIAVLADRRAARGARAPAQGGGDHRLPRPAVGAQGDRRHPALWLAQTGRACPRHGAGAAADPARRADGRHELRREGGHGPLHRRPQRGVRHDGRDDRARHGRGDGHLPPRHGAGFRPQDRRGRSGRGAGRSPRQARQARRRGRGAGRSRRQSRRPGVRGMMDYAGRVAQADTYPKLLRLNAKEHGGEIALREKDFGLWRLFTWTEYQSRVHDFALGMVELGLGRGDVVGIIGDNRPDWVAAEIATHAIAALSLGLYRDVLDEEAAYLLNYGEAKLVFAEDEEQVDKLLTLADRVPALKHIVYSDPRGMRKYDDIRLMEADKLAAMGRERAAREPGLYDRLVDATSGEDVAILCTTSGTTAHPKLAMLAAGRVLRHCATYLAFDPKGPDDEYVSVLPLPWIMEQVYVLGKGLLCRMKINFVEQPDTMMNDFREIAPTFVLFAPRVWESIAADVRAGVMDSSPLKQRLYDVGMRTGLAALARGRHSAIADLLLFRALRDRLGFARLRSAATGGAALGPDTFKFFQAMGVPLRTLYGQTELLGAYTLHPFGQVHPDTTGVPMAEDIQIRVDNPDVNGVGEIVVRHPNMFLGYYKSPEASAADVKDGWMHSGDAGYFNDNGQLVVIDRIKDLAETARGERFSPQYIENKLKFSPYIAETVVLGAGRDALAAMICIRFSIISKWAEKSRIAFTTYTDLASRPEVYALLRKEVESVNATLPPAQRISKFLLLYKELDADDGELTRTRKVRRSVINEKYAGIIDAIYGGKRDIPVDTVIRFQDGTTQRIRTTLRVIDLTPSPATAEAAE